MSLSNDVNNEQLNLDALLVAPATKTLIDGAAYHGCSVEELITMAMYWPVDIPSWDGKNANPIIKQWIPGMHLASGSTGPRRGRYKVMAIGKMPGFVGDRGDGYTLINTQIRRLLFGVAREIDWPEMNDWYYTNLVKYIPSDRGKTLKPQHVFDSMPILAQEIAINCPEVLVLFGADVVKAICGKNSTLGSMRGAPYILRGIRGLGEMPQPLHELDSIAAEYKPMKIITTVAPGAILREGGLIDGFRADLRIAKKVSKREDIMSPTDVSGRNYVYATDPDQLEKIVDNLILQTFREYAVDCEWGSRDFKAGALRTIQFSWAKDNAVVVPLCFCGGAPLDPVVRRRLIEQLRRLLCRPGVKLIGHNFRSDAKRMEYLGLSVMPNFFFDTMIADHILNENAEHGLEACAVRYTDMGRYDIPLAKWLKDNGYNKKKMRECGYLFVPDELLYPYAACDVDADLQVYYKLVERLNLPENESLLRLFNTILMPCSFPLHEAETNGVLVDRDQMIRMVDQYETKKVEILGKLQTLVGNPNFNPRSYKQACELLFENLKLQPFKTTGKPSRMWEDVLQLPDDERKRYNPSTDAESLESMSMDDTGIVAMFRDFKIIDQMTKSFLRGSTEQDDGTEEFEEGLVGSINQVDGRIHTNLSQTSETGRQKSSDPNMTNLPKKQEKEFERILPEAPKIRSCFIAAPGKLIVEADYKSAEIFTLGYLSNSHALIRDAASDLHARGAVTDFNCPKWDGFDQFKKPPKDWLKEYKSERVGSKTVRFGIPYQRGAAAISRQIIRETKGKIMCTPERAQELIDNFYQMYPDVRNYVDMCKNAVINPGYITNAYGRRRRFMNIAREDKSSLAAYQREAVNMPIQGTVAETLNVAMINMYYWRKIYAGRCDYKFLLPVHDAMLIEVSGQEAPIVVEEILPQCMKWGAVIPSWEPVPGYKTVPFTLDIDVEVYSHWGMEVTKEELAAAGVSEKYIEEWTHE